VRYFWWLSGLMAGGFLTQLEKGDGLGMFCTGFCAVGYGLLAWKWNALTPAPTKREG